MAKLAKVFNFLVLMLEAKDFARIWHLIHLRWIHACSPVHWVKWTNCWSFIKIHHILSLIERVAHGLWSSTIVWLSHWTHLIWHHHVRSLWCTSSTRTARYTLHQLGKDFHNFFIGRKSFVAEFLVLLSTAFGAHTVLVASCYLLLHTFVADRMEALWKHLGNPIKLVELLHAVITVHY